MQLMNNRGRTSRILTAFVRWFDAEAGGGHQAEAVRKEVDWLRIVPLLFLHLVSGGFLGRLELDSDYSGPAALHHSHVCHHRVLPPLFFAQSFQNQPFLAVCFWRHGQCIGSARSAVVGGPSPPSSPLYGSGAGRSLAQSSWILVEPYRLVDLEGEFPHQL